MIERSSSAWARLICSRRKGFPIGKPKTFEYTLEGGEFRESAATRVAGGTRTKTVVWTRISP